ncbi:hypothetical protein ACSBL2_07950 [Pedobacter sp. AW31-3R]|uniref:hypothetical protein n=1 Tax=Pedobacter sp. AW31-3R TaxID=3445781 RepID=UPI003FA038B6
MKKSTLIMVATLICLLGYLILFNFKMKEQIVQTNKNSAFVDMDFYAAKDLENIDLTMVNGLSLSITSEGEEGIWIGKRIKDNISMDTSAKHKLVLKISDENTDTRFHSTGGEVKIITKKLRSVSARPYAESSFISGKTSSGIGRVSISGHKLNYFYLFTGSFLQTELRNMHIENFTTAIGKNNFGGSLELSRGVKVNHAKFQLSDGSKLEMGNAKIEDAVYKLSGLAKVTRNGILWKTSE